MNDQTFHTPSFGDEEFDLPPMHMQGGHQMSGMHHAQHLQHYQHHQAPQMGMINPAQDGLIEGQPSYQQPVYLQPQEHPMHKYVVADSYGSPQQPPGNYLIQQQPGGPRLLVMQPPQQPSQQQQQNQQTQMQQPQQQGVGQQPQYGRSPPQGAGPQDTHNTTSEDSDDSAQHHAPMGPAAVKRPSPEPAGVDPIQGGPMAKQLAKKPKVQKKKKKRDPNEPQKPVSAYALFFRDTQAAIKGQNPNASFGEVSKIVASMWDGLDSEHKSVYKQKTEAAKKDYLKALAAYRASLVSKGGTESEGGVSPGMYNATNGGNAPNMSGYPTPASYYPSQGGSPPDPARSPLLSPPHHMGMGMMGHMGPPHHHHQYMHHSQPPQSNQMQPHQSPHQSPQHHMPPGPMGTQQHMGPQGMGQQQLSPMGPQMGQQMQPQQMPPQNQQMQSQNQQMPPQNQQIPSQNQQMPPQNQQMASQNQQMQPQNQQSQMPPQVQQQMNQQNQHMSPNQNQHMSPSQQMAQQQQQQMGQQGGHMGQQMMGPQSVAQQQQLSNSPTHQMMSPQGPPLGMPQQHHSPPHGTQLNQHPMMASHPQQQQTNGNTEQRTSCIRHGCTNPAIANSEWEDEYCSNECVVSHCRDVFTSWVASNNNQSQTYSAVK